MKNYNGWNNYATWKVNLEVFGDSYELFKDYSAIELQDYVEESLELYCENGLTLSYAMAFVEDADFDEIYEAIQDYCNQD